MSRKITVTFTGVVIDVTVALDGDPVTLSTNATADKWIGSQTVPDDAPSVVDMVILAPRFTDWTLVVKGGSKKLVDDSDRTHVNPFSKTWDLSKEGTER